MELVINLNKIKFGSLNKKYYGNFGLTKEYRGFKDLLIASAKKIKIKPPYSILMTVSMYQDIDNIIKPVFDALQTKGIIDNDKNVQHINISKYPIRRGGLGSICVYVDTLREYE